MSPDNVTPDLPFGDSNVDDTSGIEYVLCSNWSIGPLLARGCLLPPGAGDLTEISFFDEQHRDALLFSRRSIPAGWCAALRESRRNTFPIGIRLRGSGMRLGKSPTDMSGRAISIGDVDALVFSDSKEMKNFSSMAFADLDPMGLGVTLEVVPEVFEGSDPDEESEQPQTTAVAAHSPTDDPARIQLRRADALAALRAVLLAAAPGTRPWVESLLRTSGKAGDVEGEEGAWVAAIMRGILTSGEEKEQSLESALLAGCSSVLLEEFGLEAGWPATEVLARIEEATRRRCADDVLAADGPTFERWSERCREVLEARVEPQPLRDDRSVGLRAIIFLLLRAEIEPILETQSGEDSGTVLEVGPQVRTLAACLAAVRTGLRSLPSELKILKGSVEPRSWTDYLGRGVLAHLGYESELRRTDADALTANYRTIGLLQGEWVLAEGGRELTRKPREVDPALTRLAAMGRELGYDLAEHGDAALGVSLRWPDGRGQPVFLGVRRDNVGASPIVRFWSPALDVSSGGKGAKKWPTPALNKTKKTFLLYLLERNASPDLSCRFAISREEEAVIVLVDQLLATLDDQEFQQQIEHVARVADDFERERGVDEFR